MSLLMKALQQAAQNRGTPGSDPAATGTAAGDGLSLEPIPGSEAGGGVRPDPWPGAPDPVRQAEAARAEPSARPALAGPLSGGGSAMTSLTRIQWILILGGLAGSLLGSYVYIEVNHPGLWHRGFAALAPATPPPAALTPAPPPPPAVAAPAPPLPLDLPPLPPTDSSPARERPSAVAGGSPARDLSPPTATVGTARPASAVPATTPPGAAPLAAAPAEGPVPAPGRRPAAGGEDTRRAAGRTPEPATSAPPPAEPAAGEPIRITRDGGAAAVDPGLAQGYEHLQAGRLDAAVAAYRAVLARQPGSVDALLGVAAVAVARGDPEAARELYQRALRAEPRNAWAQAGWLSLLAQSDPAGAEAQLRELIAREPSAMLWSRLGGLLASQGRWPQAQQAYFQAHSLQPDSPDHAFNLAVSLERIAQPRIALGFLRTAVRLAETGAPARFDLAAARERIERLADSAGRP